MEYSYEIVKACRAGELSVPYPTVKESDITENIARCRGVIKNLNMDFPLIYYTGNFM